MPFGLDLKSIVVGIILAWFLLPWLTSFISNLTGKGAKASV